MTASTRPIAGDGGTDNRIECDDGHYWVRLWTRQAIRREGAAMGNCLSLGRYDGLAGTDDPKADGLWSLRDGVGQSIALMHVKFHGRDVVGFASFLAPRNRIASPFAYRQLRHLMAFLVSQGAAPDCVQAIGEPVTRGPDGMTYRWDKAPVEARLHNHEERMEARRRADAEAKRRREAAKRARENQPPIPGGIPPGGAIFVSADPARMAAISGFEVDLTTWADDDAEGNRIGAMRRRYRAVDVQQLTPEQVIAGRRIVGETVDVGQGATLNRQANGLFQLRTNFGRPFICEDLRLETTTDATEARVTCTGRTFDLLNGVTLGGTEFQFEVSREDYQRLMGGPAAYDAFVTSAERVIRQGLGL